MADKATAVLKECLSAVISLVILGLAAKMALSVFSAAPVLGQGGVEGFNRQKDIMMLVLGFLTTVTGYYFGRIPAEWRAQKAEQSASNSQEQAAKAREDKARAVEGVQHAKNTLDQQSREQRLTLGAGETPPGLDALDAARRSLDDLLNRLR